MQLFWTEQRLREDWPADDISAAVHMVGSFFLLRPKVPGL
jgi:hypothetical protein